MEKEDKEEEKEEKKPIVLSYRYSNNGFPSWVSNSTSHLKRCGCCRWGCWSSVGGAELIGNQMTTGNANGCAFSHGAQVQLEIMQGLLASALDGTALELARWGGSTRVGRQQIPCALCAFAPLCVFNGDKCEAHGVQSHCGLKRISDDRKYVNLLFPSEQRKKVQSFNGPRR